MNKNKLTKILAGVSIISLTANMGITAHAASGKNSCGKGSCGGKKGFFQSMYDSLSGKSSDKDRSSCGKGSGKKSKKGKSTTSCGKGSCGS
ncbi:MAG: hypothetical protein GF409_07785 [Candidatus Omnitrophica bacterium]|nr:hypothetical protein [Candidatus Omnitrophota bacterium]